METIGPPFRDLLLSLHLLAIAFWIGGGSAELWLGFKEASMVGVLLTVAAILGPALRMGVLIGDLPAGPGPAGAEIVAACRRLEPGYLAMRVAAVVAVVLAVSRPVLA